MSSVSINGDLASRVGSALVGFGPTVSPEVAQEVVADLRRCADVAAHVMADATLLGDAEQVSVRVVDRPTWIDHNARMAMTLLGQPQEPSLWDHVSGAATGLQFGLVLPLVAHRVLGQYDPFSDPPVLLLVAPNVAETAAALQVDRYAFSLWVCLHEVTHRLQFHRAPWLVGHLQALLRRVVGAESSPLAGWRPGAPLPRTVADLLLGVDGKAAFDEITAVMTVLEGHADVMMDRTSAVPGVADIRARFQTRREAGGLDAIVRAVIGLDLKLAQYREGAEFCRRVIAAVGVEGLNVAFESPAAMPTRAEIADPDLWVRRTTREA